MIDRVAKHYGGRDLEAKIESSLRRAGKDLVKLTIADLAPYDEFHFRGRRATLELARQMGLDGDSHVLDIGSGLGGAARALAGEYGCHVTGIDLTQAFCDAATTLSDWLDLGDRTQFQQGDATRLPFPENRFDAAMTIHTAMNIPDKRRVYDEARRVVRHGGIFAVYDILQGDGGEVAFPVPWAEDRTLSHLVTSDEMQALLSAAGFAILTIDDSSDESHASLETAAASQTRANPANPASPTQILFGDKFPEMARNQLRGLAERRIRTISYICRA